MKNDQIQLGNVLIGQIYISFDIVFNQYYSLHSVTSHNMQ